MLFSRHERRIRRILIVEDEPLVAFDTEHMLKEDGYEIVATVDNLADALGAIAAEPIDLVLTDIVLSGDGDGLDVARAAGARAIPVLFVTGHSNAQAERLGVGCLSKPYSEKVLKSALEALDRHLRGEKRKRLPPQLTLYATA